MKKSILLFFLMLSIGSFAQNDVTFNVDMNCYDSTFDTVYVTGPFFGWCGDCSPLSDDDLDGIWTGTYSVETGDLEYKYQVDNWNDQEDLVDDMVAGGSCAPITDFFGYANRLLAVDGAASADDVFGQCSACVAGEGCTDLEALNYDMDATIDDGSCLFNVSFNVDMNCYESMFITVFVSGPFTSWCGNCFPLTDDDSDGIWTGDYPFLAGDYEFIYELDNWTAQEDLIEDMINGGTCAPITDFDSYANRAFTVDGEVVTADVYDSCLPCSANPVLGCTNPEAINYNPLATENDFSCLFDVYFSVDMNCDTADFNTVYVTGPFNGWCGDCNPMSDNDFDGIWTLNYISNGGILEYKYAVDNFASQEDLIDDMIAGGDCAPITDFSSFANRSIEVLGIMNTSDSYGSCTACNAVVGCTDPDAVNYSPTAIEDDGSCNYEVNFSVDMNCDTVSFTTVYISGPFTSWCGDCFPLADDDLDGVWEGTYVFGLGDLEYKYEVDNFANQENLIDDMIDGGDCAPITDFDTFANRLITIVGALDVEDIYGACTECGPLDECPVASAIICDNFDSYGLGPINGEGAHWSTWSGTLGGAEDGIVSSQQAFSNNRSMLIAEGSIQDVILLLGNQSSGEWTISWMEFIPESATAYYNIQESETPAVAWNMEVFFNQDGGAPGVGTIVGNAATFSYPEGEWFEVIQTIDLENDLLTLSIDGVEVFNDFAYAGNIGSINFFSTDATNRYYIDDLVFDGEPVSVEELSADEFNIYPNPSTGIFKINTERNIEQIIVRDILGKEVVNKNITERKITQLDLTEFTNGVYAITLFSEGNNVTKKLILE
ncbi:MAG: hypothetical protein ACI86P_001363 [Flavobacteriales bacterium]|jgi:hypothetical protein